MHELSLLSDLLRKVNSIATENGATKVTRVTVQLGALAHISPDHLREHFEEAVAGTIANKATLEVIPMDDITDPHAQDIMLDSVEVE